MIQRVKVGFGKAGLERANWPMEPQRPALGISSPKMKLDRKCRISGFKHHLPRQGSSPEILIQEVRGANQESTFNRFGTTMRTGLRSQRYITSEQGATSLPNIVSSLFPLRASLKGEAGEPKGEGAMLGVGSL